MKIRFLFVLMLVLLLCGCSRRYSEGAVIGGIPVGGMTREEAQAALENAAGEYSLRVNLEGTETVLTSRQLGVSFLGGHVGDTVQQVFSVAPPEDLLPLLKGVRTDKAPMSAPIRYSEAEEAFLTGQESDGVHWDYSEALEEILRAARAMEPEVTVSPRETVLEALPANEDPRTLDALEEANALLQKDLTICIRYPGDESGETADRETLTPGLIASWLRLQEDGFTVLLDRDAVLSYCRELDEKYSIPGYSGSQFVTTDGRAIVLDAPEGNTWVDRETLAEEICRRLEGGTRSVMDIPFLPEGQGPMETEDFGGTYVEVDLSSQMVYCYKDGDLVVETPCVTGCVANNDDTPKGVYDFYYMDRDAWLEGPTWLDWVDCWMAFYGGYGMHDASWRTEFGGDIYLENGSHGCINLPPEAAPLIYDAMDIGDAIIIY